MKQVHLNFNVNSDANSGLAYISVITNDDYLPGVLVLFTSLLQTGSKFPFLCIITPTVSLTARAALEFIKVTLIEVEPIPSPYDEQADIQKRPALRAGYTKIALWNVQNYERLLYLDADMMVFNLPIFC